MTSRAVLPLLLVLSLLPAVGCDKATPVAPNGAILTISANPSQVALNGRSTITIVGRKPDGQPLNPGTEIRLSAERGTIDSIVTTDDQGRATATFRADGRTGDVKITASTGGDTMAETTVLVGQSDSTRPTVLVSVTPSTVAIGGEAEVTVIARNADGTPINGGRATLTTSLGRLTDSTPNIVNGTATTTLEAGQREGTATITAIVGSSAAVTTTATIILDLAAGITVTANPASIRSDGGDDRITVTALVTNSRGLPVEGAVVTFESELGTFDNNTSVRTDEDGEATKVLTVTDGQIPPSTQNFEITVQTTSSSGGFIDETTTVRIIRPTGGT